MVTRTVDRVFYVHDVQEIISNKKQVSAKEKGVFFSDTGLHLVLELPLLSMHEYTYADIKNISICILLFYD